MGLVRWVAAVGALVMLGVSPAHAGSGSAGGISVTIPDVVLASYDCTVAPVTVSVSADPLQGWTAAVTAGPTGKDRLDAVGFAGRGPAQVNGTLLMCPADSVGPWTATVDSRVVLTQSQFTVGFSVRQLTTTTSLVSVRTNGTVVRARGTVVAENGIPGRASVAIRGKRNGTWRLLGHTEATEDGRFRFVAPRRVTQVRAEYLGDSVTEPSQAQMRAQKVGPAAK